MIRSSLRSFVVALTAMVGSVSFAQAARTSAMFNFDSAEAPVASGVVRFEAYENRTGFRSAVSFSKYDGAFMATDITADITLSSVELYTYADQQGQWIRALSYSPVELAALVQYSKFEIRRGQGNPPMPYVAFPFQSGKLYKFTAAGTVNGTPFKLDTCNESCRIGKYSNNAMTFANTFDTYALVAEQPEYNFRSFQGADGTYYTLTVDVKQSVSNMTSLYDGLNITLTRANGVPVWPVAPGQFILDDGMELNVSTPVVLATVQQTPVASQQWYSAPQTFIAESNDGTIEGLSYVLVYAMANTGDFSVFEDVIATKRRELQWTFAAGAYVPYGRPFGF